MHIPGIIGKTIGDKMREKIGSVAKKIALDVDQLDRILMCSFRESDDADKMLGQAEDIKALAQDIVLRARTIGLYLIDEREKGNEA